MPPFGLIAWPVMRTACATSLASATKNSTWAAGARAHRRAGLLPTPAVAADQRDARRARQRELDRGGQADAGGAAGDQYSAFRKGARMQPGVFHHVVLPFWSRVIHDERERD